MFYIDIDFITAVGEPKRCNFKSIKKTQNKKIDVYSSEV